jgi:hypothetical protein
MASDVFVSHSIKDKAVAEAIVARLEADSVTCWLAPRDVVPGADWGESIIDAIESSRIMILIFSRNADASPQIKREVERAVNKGVYIIPFRVDDIPPTKSLEYFISTSQWMDAFSPPLERHLDNLAKTVKAVLQRRLLHGADTPAQPERPSIPTPPVRASGHKAILIAMIVAALVIVGGAGWYLGQKKKETPERPAIPIEPSTPVPITPAAATAIPTLVPTAAPTITPQSPPPSTPLSALTTAPPPPPIDKVITDQEVRNFVTSFFLAEERGDIDYMLSQYIDSFKWGPQQDKAARRVYLNDFIKKWPVRSFSVGDIRVVHSDVPDMVTAYFEYQSSYRDPASGRNDSGPHDQEWVISKTSGALKIVQRKPAAHHDAPTPSIAPSGGLWLFPDSSSRYLSPTELSKLSSDDLWHARNEIFARRGLKFTSPRGMDLARRLGNDYRGVDDNQDRVFNSMNEFEKANVKLIQSIESSR